MKISKRLIVITYFLKDKKRVIDVGCHHGLVDIYLKRNYPNIDLLATDNKEGSLKCAIDNFKKYNLKIDVKLTDGLEGIKLNKDDTILLSGMGTYTILKILNNYYDLVNDIVVQSNNNLYLLRREISSKGYYIAKEAVVYDKKKYYVIINFKKGNKKYSYKDLLLGPIIRKENYDEYFEYLKNKLIKKHNNIPKKRIIKRLKVRYDLFLLKNRIK